MLTIGIGIVTCNREDFYKQVINSLLKLKDNNDYRIVTVNDSTTDEHKKQYIYPFGETIIHSNNMGVLIYKE